MLRARTLGTHGFVREGQKSLTFRLWNLAGSSTLERLTDIWIFRLWATEVLGKAKRDDAVALFRKLFRNQELRGKKRNTLSFFLT